jgi:hypothetical protein
VKLKCGDKIKLKMEFEAPLKDEMALVFIFRKDLYISNNTNTVISGTQIKIPWPDIEVDGKWVGAAQACFAGLKKDWDEKWKEQEFYFDVFVGDKEKKSKTMTIERFNNKMDTHTVTCTCAASKRASFVVHDDGGVRRIPYYKIVGEPTDYPVKFDIELKDDMVILTLRPKWKFIFDYDDVDEAAKEKPIVEYLYRALNSSQKQKHFTDFVKDFRKTVIGHWNTQLSNFVLHRKKCARGKDCNCHSGCCKFGLKLDIRPGNYATIKVVLGKGRANEGRFFTMESRPGLSWAHEMGHHLGLPDEYLGGYLAVGNDSGKFKRGDSSALMDSGPKVYKRYVEFIVDKWISSATGEDFEVIDRREKS